MTDKTSLVNLALQSFGSRTTVTTAELAANSTNEAIQANLTFDNTRNSLLRMAPWDCSLRTANLTYITSVPGTPENTSAATNLWSPGQPRPPWAYEYQYPNDCLRACWIIPATQTGFAGGVPITTAVTGRASTTWLGGPIPFKISLDKFLMITASNVAIVTPGAGYIVGEVVTLAIALNTVAISNIVGPFNIGAPQGAAAQLYVGTVNGSGGITSVTVIPAIIDGDMGGSYFYRYFANIGQATTTNLGSGAVFSINMNPTALYDQRVILTNQEFATLVYVHQVTDPNVWDPLFQDAFVNALGFDLCLALSGDKGLANICSSRVNNSIIEARKADGNEGLTINDVTPDWIRIRGVNWTDSYMSGPDAGFNWGSGWPTL